MLINKTCLLQSTKCAYNRDVAVSLQWRIVYINMYSDFIKYDLFSRNTFMLMNQGHPGIDSGQAGTDPGQPGTDQGQPGTDQGQPETTQE